MCVPACPRSRLHVRVCMPTYLCVCPVSVYVFVWVCMSRHATSPHRDTGLKVCGLACDVHCPALKIPSQSVITSKETGQQRGELTPPSVYPTLFFSTLCVSSPFAFIVPTTRFFFLLSHLSFFLFGIWLFVSCFSWKLPINTHLGMDFGQFILVLT